MRCAGSDTAEMTSADGGDKNTNGQNLCINRGFTDDCKVRTVFNQYRLL